MSTALIPTRPQVATEVSTALAETSARAVQAFQAANMDQANVAQALEVAAAIDDLRLLFDRAEVKARISALQDTALGFRTDADPKVWNKKKGAYNVPYEWPVIRDAAIEATLRGLQLVGNHFNVISGRFYATREGFEFLIRRHKAVTDFRLNVGVPTMKQGGALVECRGAWLKDGKAQTLDATIPVKCDDFSGADQIIGKAIRKFLKRCYEQMTGDVLPEGDALEGKPEIPAQAATPAAGPTPFADRGRTKPPTPAPATSAPAQAPAAATPPPAPAPAAPAPAQKPAAPAPEGSPRFHVTETLQSAGITFETFVGWLVSTGRMQGGDAILADSIADIPDAVIADILAENMAGLRKCLTIHAQAAA